uniref:Putative secreted protein n=1 Tax=Anopheles darlingi TaxID=43151 RepID=A0A2M4DPX1_ANODA
MARASTVAVVVPSPASSFVLLATSCTSLAPMFWNLHFSSMPLATVTPSLVIFGEPQLCSRITLRPFGPIVTATASANTSTPCSISARTSGPNRTSLAYPRLAATWRAALTRKTVGSRNILSERERLKAAQIRPNAGNLRFRKGLQIESPKWSLMFQITLPSDELFLLSP